MKGSFTPKGITTLRLRTADLGEAAIYTRLNGTSGHFFPRWKDGAVCLCLCGCLRCAAEAKVQAILTECSPFRKQYPPILVFCIPRDSSPFVLPVSFCRCFSPLFWMPLAHLQILWGFVSLLVCYPQTAAKLKTSISSSSKIL